VSVGEEQAPVVTWESADGVLRVAATTGLDGRPVVALTGELDIATAHEVAARLADALAEGKGLVVDLGELRFIDSTGISTLLVAHKCALDGGHVLVLRAPVPNVRKTLSLVGLDQVFRIEG